MTTRFETCGLFDREPPEVVRNLAAVVGFRRAGLCPIGLTELIEAEAARMEAAGEKGGETW